LTFSQIGGLTIPKKMSTTPSEAVLMAKHSRYYVKPDEIQTFLTELGHEVKVVYNLDNERVRLDVVGTTVEISYDLIINGKLYAYGNITVRATLDPKETERSEKLYQKLKRKFGKPAIKSQ
jgi:hypothetical protein